MSLIKLLRKLIVAIPFCITATACSSVDYVDNKTLQESNLVGGNLVSNNFSEQGGAFKGMKQFGALVIKPKNKDADPKVFMLRREKQKLVAETMLYDSKGDKKSMFDQTYFAFGANRETSTFGVSFRFVY